MQKVPLAGFTPQSRLRFSSDGQTVELASGDYLARSLRYVPEVSVRNSEVVFVGYGVVAPEYGWDDFKGVDVRGKTVIFLIGDPPIPDPSDPQKLDEKMFGGKAMTYYGRWAYKFEIASEKGAAAALIVHEAGPAGYPMEALASWRQESFDLRAPDKNMSRVAVEAWLAESKVRELLPSAGLDFDALKAAALRKDFKPIPLNATADIEIKTALREVDSRNVVAKLVGSDPKLRDEYVVYSAQWDHMLRDTRLAGDQVFNGALDNASGTASLLEIAEAFTKLKAPPRRSILFLALTAEEKDAQLLFEVGLRVAQGDQWPEWKPGTEFKAKRDRMLRK